MRTNHDHDRESGVTETVVLRAILVMGVAFSGITMDQRLCASPFPTTTIGMYQVVVILIVIVIACAIQKVSKARADGRKLHSRLSERYCD